MIRSISNSSSSDSARSIPASECSCVRETGRAVLDVARQNQLLALHHIHDSAVLHSVVPDVDARLHLGCESRTALHLDHMTEGVTPEHAPMQRTWWFCMAIQRLERCHARRLAQCRPVPDVRSVSSRTTPQLARQTSMQHHGANRILACPHCSFSNPIQLLSPSRRVMQFDPIVAAEAFERLVDEFCSTVCVQPLD